MSRHFCDIGQILNSDYGIKALKNTTLFENIIGYGSALTPMKTTDYNNLTLKTLNIIPPDELIENYKSDYKEMQDSMIHGKSPDFDTLLENIINELK